MESARSYTPDAESAVAAVSKAPTCTVQEGKALLELRELGWLSGELPRLVAVQATGCAPIVEAFERGAAESVTAVNAHTVASGLNVPKAVGDFLVLNALRQTNGTSIAVTDTKLLAAQQQLARSEGTFVCPEGAACFAAVDTPRSAGWLQGDETVIVLNTGAGLKYPGTVTAKVPTLPHNGHIPPEQATTPPTPPSRPATSTARENPEKQ